jgi:predicted enzyme related to lactoylglutathione lyase
MQYGMVQGEGDGIGGGIAGAQEGDSPVVTVYVEVDQIQPYLDNATSMGGKVVMERTVLPGMVTMAQFVDPDGNLIGLTEPGVPQG